MTVQAFLRALYRFLDVFLRALDEIEWASGEIEAYSPGRMFDASGVPTSDPGSAQFWEF